MTLLCMGDEAYAELGLGSAVERAKVRAETLRRHKGYIQTEATRRLTRYGAGCAALFSCLFILLLIVLLLTLVRVWS